MQQVGKPNSLSIEVEDLAEFRKARITKEIAACGGTYYMIMKPHLTTKMKLKGMVIKAALASWREAEWSTADLIPKWGTTSII